MGEETIDVSEMINSFKGTIAEQAAEIAILKGRVAYLLSQVVHTEEETN